MGIVRRVRSQVTSRADLWILLRAAAVMAVLPLLLRLSLPRFVRTLDWLSAALGSRRPGDDERIEHYVDILANRRRWSFQDNCLARAFTRYVLLNRRGSPLELVFGVHERCDASGHAVPGRRHVWLVRDGVPYLEREPVDQYVVTYRYVTPQNRHTSGELAGDLWLAMGVSGLAAGFVIAASVARNKLVAIGFGPEGLGVLGQLSGVAVTAAYVATFGAATGVARFLSEALAARDEERAREVVRTAVHVLAWPSLALALVLALTVRPVAAYALGDASHAGWIRWLVPCVPLTAAASLAMAVLRAERRVRRLAMAQVTGAVVGVGAAWLLAASASLDALAALPAAVTAAQAIAGFVAAWPDLWPLLRGGKGRWNRRTAGDLASYGVTSVGLMLVTTLVSLAIGRAYFALGRAGDAGQFRALQMLSEGSFAVLMGGYHAWLFPTFCRASTRDEAQQLLNRFIRAAIGLTLPLMIGLSLGAPLVLQLLYSTAFVPSAPLLRLQMAGDLLRVAQIVLGLPLLARGRLGLLLALQVAWGGLCLALFGWWGAAAGPRAWVLAHVLSGAVYAPVLALACRQTLGVSVGRKEMVLLAGAVAVLVWLARSA